MLFKTIGYFLYIILFTHVCSLLDGHPVETWKSAFFKVLPIIHLIFIAMSTTVKTKGHENYKRTILLGLCFSLAGDVALVWREKNFILGIVCFAVTQLFYMRAFGFKPRGSAPIMVSCLMLAGLAFMYLESGIGAPVLKGLVLGYSVLIFGMFWRSWILMQSNPSVGAACAVIGAFIFIISDFLIAKDKFVGSIPDSQVWVMGTYYAAQLFITGSVAYYKPHPYKKEDEMMYTHKERLN